MSGATASGPAPRPPVLLLGLGNPGMGDDGVAARLLDELAGDPRLEGRVELAWGGTDLLAAAELLRGRRRVLLVDAIEADDRFAAGEAALLDPRDGGLDERSAGAHSLSLPGCLRLLDAVEPALTGVEVRLFAVPIAAATIGTGLSPALEARLPELAGRLREECSRGDAGDIE